VERFLVSPWNWQGVICCDFVCFDSVEATNRDGSTLIGEWKSFKHGAHVYASEGFSMIV
jgi:hypothetical protein